MAGDSIDWDALGESIDDLADMVERLRHAWAQDNLADEPRLKQVRYFLGKTEGELAAVSFAVQPAPEFPA